MADLGKVIKTIEICYSEEHNCTECELFYVEDCNDKLMRDVLELLKKQEPIEPTINEYGEAYCICGENVGIIPSSKNLPSIRSKYCSECGRRMKWE